MTVFPRGGLTWARTRLAAASRPTARTPMTLPSTENSRKNRIELPPEQGEEYYLGRRESSGIRASNEQKMGKHGCGYRDSDHGQQNNQVDHSEPLKKQAEKQQASEQFLHGSNENRTAPHSRAAGGFSKRRAPPLEKEPPHFGRSGTPNDRFTPLIVRRAASL